MKKHLSFVFTLVLSFCLVACSSSNNGRNAASESEELQRYDLSYFPDQVAPFSQQDVADYVNQRVLGVPGFIQSSLKNASLVWGDQEGKIEVGPEHVIEVSSFVKSEGRAAGAVRLFRVFVPSPVRKMAGTQTRSYLMEIEVEAAYADGVQVYRDSDGSRHRDISVRSYKANFEHKL